MASIFTFDPDPPRVSSPWAAATPPSGRAPQHRLPQDTDSTRSLNIATEGQSSLEDIKYPTADYNAITRLKAEPQEGPVEYKLHLLLRKRRSFTRSSTRRHLSGSLRRAEFSAPVPMGRNALESEPLSITPPPASATQSRQHRLEQLTTQMLWRLQQSCPHHTSSSTAGVLAQFPNETHLDSPLALRRLYPGLEESKGALYELGVADDGELVGLAEDELDESLNNLRAMAASLGCRVEVQRTVTVGECEWVESADTLQPTSRTSKLLVAEALVSPGHSSLPELQDSILATNKIPSPRTELDSHQDIRELRISFTGGTMSGKSTLLGTLSTGTLDNGRGKSRLSLLKHRHEIESGLTSSITQELIGYSDETDSLSYKPLTRVVNYGSTDVSSWTDIHESSAAGRVVFLTDSAGHPRFHRTTVRGLVGWDPHYALLCVAADTAEDSSGNIGISSNTKEHHGSGNASSDHSQEHLGLCLSLDLPLLVVITKYDLATKAVLKSVLSRVVTTLKDAGRKCSIITDPSPSFPEVNLETISSEDLLEAAKLTQALQNSPTSVVPIILTSAVKGTGLRKLHAFLRELPVPKGHSPPQSSSGKLFHVEESYEKPSVRAKSLEAATIIGGHLHYGALSIGDQILLGPYSTDASSDDSDSGSGRRSAQSSPMQTSRSFPGAMNKVSSTVSLQSRSGHVPLAEWRRVRITSLRNLRQPVRTLHAGQVGTIGILPVDVPITSPAINRIRKGMVLVDGNPKAHRIVNVRFAGINARSARALSIGSAVVVYFASVRASSKVLSVISANTNTSTHANGGTVIRSDGEEEEGFSFGFDEDTANDPSDSECGSGALPTAGTTITFQFIATREFIEPGAKVLVMPGGGPGVSASVERGEKGVAKLEGFVGRVIDAPA